MLLRTILSIPSLVWITTLSHEIHQIFLPKIFSLKLLWHYESPHGSNKIIPGSLLVCALVQFSKTKQKSLTHTLCNFSHFFFNFNTFFNCFFDLLSTLTQKETHYYHRIIKESSFSKLKLIENNAIGKDSSFTGNPFLSFFKFFSSDFSWSSS